VLVPLGLFASVSGFSLWRGHRGRRQTREATRHLRRLQADIKVCSVRNSTHPLLTLQA
jgi:hypothetical protein